MTRLTSARERVLAFVYSACQVYGAGNPDWIGPYLRSGPETLAALRRLAPKRKPAWHDMTGRALRSCLDWLQGPHLAPMRATVEEVAAALGRPVPPPWNEEHPKP